MGKKFQNWVARSNKTPKSYDDLSKVLYDNRKFKAVEKLEYGDYGLSSAISVISKAIQEGKRIALYADYDVDGTMSCVSWIWFLRSIKYENFIHYIPDRFKEGYGVNLKAVKYLVEEKKADLIITMDTGITANAEALWCKEKGVSFVCTDHHKIQADKMPDCIILNPKLHPDPSYQELCGCGITFVLLRKLGQLFTPPAEIWLDLLALTGMATVCDVVPLNGVNHKLIQQGVQALWQSNRKILKQLLKAASIDNSSFDERDLGFRLGPRINAVGRLDHADKIIEAFIGDHANSLIRHMGVCNEKRKKIQTQIVEEASKMAEEYPDDPILFLGSESWHQGVVGIAASKIAERFWKPTWLFQTNSKACKGSARSVPNFDVTDAMLSTNDLFLKFGGHKAAGGYSFASTNEEKIRSSLNKYAQSIKKEKPSLWESSITYDCSLPAELTHLNIMDHLSPLRPFGHGFEEPVFKIDAQIEDVQYYNDKDTGEPKHTAILIENNDKHPQKIVFFNEVYQDIYASQKASFLVTASKNTWRNKVSLSLIGCDIDYH